MASKTKQPTVYLIRHGKTALNGGPDSKDRIRGWKDVPLDSQGKKEAHQTADKLSKVLNGTRPGVIHTSDLSRSADTAQIIANKLGSDVQPTRNLRPWNAGELQGSLSEDAHKIMAYHAEHQPDAPLPGGGESFNTFKSRYLTELNRHMKHAEATGDTQVLVAHYRNQKMAEAHIKARKQGGGKGGKGGEIDMKHFLSKDGDHTGSGLRIYKDDKGWNYEHI